MATFIIVDKGAVGKTHWYTFPEKAHAHTRNKCSYDSHSKWRTELTVCHVTHQSFFLRQEILEFTKQESPLQSSWHVMKYSILKGWADIGCGGHDPRHWCVYKARWKHNLNSQKHWLQKKIVTSITVTLLLGSTAEVTADSVYLDHHWEWTKCSNWQDPGCQSLACLPPVDTVPHGGQILKTNKEWG